MVKRDQRRRFADLNKRDAVLRIFRGREMLQFDTMITLRNLSTVQTFLLGRLERLAAIRGVQIPALEPWQKALLSRAIYSTYRDCLDHGLADEAQLLIYGEIAAV